MPGNRLARWWRRTATAAALVAGFLLGSGGAAAAAPPATAPGDLAAVADWPVELQELIAGTPAFAAAPWFTEPDCADKGGDVALYLNTYFRREGAFQQQLAGALTAEDAAAGPSWTAGSEPWLTGVQVAPPEVFPAGDTAYDVRYRTCAADLAAWTTPDASSPWGFRWADRPDARSLQRMRTIAATQYGGELDPLTVCQEPGSYLCSRAFFADCDQAAETDRSRCEDWNFSVQQHLSGMDNWIEANKDVGDRVAAFFAGVGEGLWSAGAWAVDALGWVVGKVGAAIGWIAKKGMEQVVAFFTEGAVWLWGTVTAWLIDFQTPNLAGGGFVTTYNLMSGLMLAVAFLIWVAGLAMAWRRGQLASSLGGAVRAVLGVQLVGVIAVLMLALANEATQALITAQSAQLSDADFTVSLVAVNPTVGLLAAVFAVLGLLGTALILLFQAPLVLGHALFGTIAGAGQAHRGTQRWMGVWFIKLLSLTWCKFFMVGMMILAQNMLTSTTANVAQNGGQELFSVLGGLLILLLLPTTPWLLSGIMSFTVGHASAAADRMGQSMTAAAGSAAAAAAAGPAAAAGGAAMSGAQGAASALSTMGNNLQALGELANGTFGATAAQAAGFSSASGTGGGAEAASGAEGSAGGAETSGDATGKAAGGAAAGSPGAGGAAAASSGDGLAGTETSGAASTAGKAGRVGGKRRAGGSASGGSAASGTSDNDGDDKAGDAGDDGEQDGTVDTATVSNGDAGLAPTPSPATGSSTGAAGAGRGAGSGGGAARAASGGRRSAARGPRPGGAAGPAGTADGSSGGAAGSNGGAPGQGSAAAPAAAASAASSAAPPAAASSPPGSAAAGSSAAGGGSGSSPMSQLPGSAQPPGTGVMSAASSPTPAPSAGPPPSTAPPSEPPPNVAVHDAVQGPASAAGAVDPGFSGPRDESQQQHEGEGASR